MPFKSERWSVGTNTPEGIAEKGQALYRDKFQIEYERSHPGEYLAIDIKNEAGYLGKTPDAAVEALLQENPDAYYHVVRIGAPGVYRVGYSQHPQSREWHF